ncbi:TetR/AcrR family transcriptional regulator [Enterococcus sp. HY326]|uniref:TetR/AcrR family transcriptional regulator n=1 Tax=Enterococcus sp. HY326 TaxID=2971265 RepID=UPI002240057B|nr:TetR/AcrR family transcriptional regulator [Enterococcus sp. HY326]
MEDLRKTDTKEKILQQTGYLLRKKSFQEISLREVAQASGVSAANIYKHFANKEDLFQQVLDELAKEVLREYQKNFPAENNGKAGLRQLSGFLFQKLAREPLQMEFLFFSPYSKQVANDTQSQTLYTVFLKYVEEAREEFNLAESLSSLSARLWAFLQGYSLLASRGVLIVQPEIIERTLSDLLDGGEKNA